jgi:hypothetical protein
MNESATSQFQLCFKPLSASSSGFVFPCDPNGLVDLDRMSERARNNYFYARAMMGKEVAYPAVEVAMLH